MNEYKRHVIGAGLVRTNPQRLGLIGNTCDKGHLSFPPTNNCRDCHDEILINQPKGEVFNSQMPSSAMEASMSSK